MLAEHTRKWFHRWLRIRGNVEKFNISAKSNMIFKNLVLQALGTIRIRLLQRSHEKCHACVPLKSSWTFNIRSEIIDDWCKQFQTASVNNQLERNITYITLQKFQYNIFVITRNHWVCQARWSGQEPPPHPTSTSTGTGPGLPATATDSAIANTETGPERSATSIQYGRAGPSATAKY